VGVLTDSCPLFNTDGRAQHMGRREGVFHRCKPWALTTASATPVDSANSPRPMLFPHKGPPPSPHPPPPPQVVFGQGSASTVGILLRSWHQGGEGGAAVLYNWETSLLEVVFEAMDPTTMTFSLTAPLARRIGGNVTHKPGAPLALRLLLDGRWVWGVVGVGEEGKGREGGDVGGDVGLVDWCLVLAVLLTALLSRPGAQLALRLC